MVREAPVWFEVSSLVAVIVLLVADLLIVTRRPHEPSMKESGIWVAFYVALAVAFGVVFWGVAGGQAAGEFFAGWLTEYSLSVDNLFVFVIIMSSLKVPREYQQKVLMIGIITALVLRAIFILLGAAIIERFIAVFFLFGAFLIYTAWKLARSHGNDEEYHENPLVARLRKRLPISEGWGGGKLRTVEDGKKLFTPMLIVFVAIGTTDLLFALDSIPAIFGLTRDPFIVFIANVFALMGLRQLYFLLGGLLDRLVYLTYGLAFILAFIGVKLILEALHENSLPFINGGEHVEWAPEIPIWLSLAVIIGTLAIATVASLLRTRSQNRRPSAPAAERAQGERADERVELPDEPAPGVGQGAARGDDGVAGQAAGQGAGGATRAPRQG